MTTPRFAPDPALRGGIQNFRDEELLADVICRLIGDVRHVAVGTASPIPATAALLARERGKAGLTFRCSAVVKTRS